MKSSKAKPKKQITPADKAFSKSYRNMTDQLDRVSGKTFSLWSKFTMWIYSVIFGNKYHLKSKQNEYDKYRSAESFDKITEIFYTEKDNSMTEEQVFSHSKKRFSK
ncbi:MAG: hypothetical protein AAF518_06620 [Spirochaetota bacterium]